MNVISALQSIWDGFDFSYILDIILSIVPALICITLHELSHGYVAYRLGDDTAKRSGRLSLNPLKHLDIAGLLMMLVFRVGWAKPVPVNMYRFKNPKKGMAITALAGPLSNLIICAVFLFLFGAAFIPLSGSAVGEYFLTMLQLTARISIGLCIFNLVPVPPLDGSKMLFSLLNDNQYNKLMQYERYGSIIMVLLVVSGVLGKPLSMLIDYIYARLFIIAELGFELILKIFYA